MNPDYLLEHVARLDLGQDAPQQDIDYHVAYLRDLDLEAFQDYLDRLLGPF